MWVHTSSQRAVALMHCKRQGETERQIESTGWSALEQVTYVLSSPDAHTHTHPSHQSTSTAPSQPAVWPCQMTYDMQHLRPIGGGGALSTAHTHRDREREQQAHKRHRSMHCKRDRERDPKQWVSALSSKRLTACPHQTHTHTPIPPIQHHSTEPASRVAVSDDI